MSTTYDEVNMLPLLMFAGAGLSAYGSMMGSQAQQQALNDQAATAEQNAKIAKQKAFADAEMFAIQSRKVLAEQKADFSASGVEGGSVFAVMADSKANAELDRLNILFGGNIRAAQYMSEAESKYQGAENVRQAGIYSAFGSIFSMGGGFAKQD